VVQIKHKFGFVIFPHQIFKKLFFYFIAGGKDFRLVPEILINLFIKTIFKIEVCYSQYVALSYCDGSERDIQLIEYVIITKIATISDFLDLHINCFELPSFYLLMRWVSNIVQDFARIWINFKLKRLDYFNHPIINEKNSFWLFSLADNDVIGVAFGKCGFC